MQKIPRHKLNYLSKRARDNHKRKLRRELAKHKPIAGHQRFLWNARKYAILHGTYYARTHRKRNNVIRFPGPKPAHSTLIEYLASKGDAFSEDEKPWRESGYFLIPEIFSLTENYKESFSFLKRLFYALYNQSFPKITFDYVKCTRIDLDASVSMDILLREFIHHFNLCNRKGHRSKVVDIRPVNFQKPHIRKILFSIGAFASVTGLSIKFPDIIPYPLCIGDIKDKKASAYREVDITQMVDYVLQCMAKMNKTLTETAEDNLFKVIGEVLINAEEHSTCDYRYSIGYFQDTHENGEHIGTFNLVILNFGKSIYEKFSDPNCPNKAVVHQMKELSDIYTTKRLFAKAEFEEQTLWTLYALQEGVTSKSEWRRGNGSIRFIDSFFSLKGDNEKDNISYLSIVSGNTRITFDGTYRLMEVVKGKKDQKFKMMTFNDNGSIEDKPDKKYVTFAKNYFPGTIISARISIKEDNTEVTIK